MKVLSFVLAIAAIICLGISGLSVAEVGYFCSGEMPTCNWDCYIDKDDQYKTAISGVLQLGHCYPGSGDCSEGPHACVSRVYEGDCPSGTYHDETSSFSGCLPPPPAT